MADEQNTDNTPKPGEYTPEQQAHIDSLINRRIASVNTKHQNELSTLQAQIDELKSKPATPATKTSAADGETIESLRAQVAELKAAGKDGNAETTRWKNEAQRLTGELEKEKQNSVNIRRDTVIMAAASKQNFYDASEVAELTKKYIQFNTEQGKFFVVGENGQPRINSAMEDMTPEEFYAQYAATKKHLVRGDVRPGTGATESNRSGLSKSTYELADIFGPKSNARLAAELAKSEPATYSRLRVEAVRAGLVSK